MSIRDIHSCDPRDTGATPCPLCDAGQDEHDGRWRRLAAASLRSSRHANRRSYGLTRREINRIAAEHAVLAVLGDGERAPFACDVCASPTGAWRVGGTCGLCAARGTSSRTGAWFDAQRRAKRIAETARVAFDGPRYAVTDPKPRQVLGVRDVLTHVDLDNYNLVTGGVYVRRQGR